MQTYINLTSAASKVNNCDISLLYSISLFLHYLSFGFPLYGGGEGDARPNPPKIKTWDV